MNIFSIDLKDYTIVNDVYCDRVNVVSNTFEQQYIAVRSKEGRVYTDEILAKLPDISQQHALYREWQIRKESATRFVNYCRHKKANRILEIGCGNGWLSNLAAGTGAETVVGADINLCELEQAARVFKKDNLFFVHAVFDQNFLPGISFDMIVFPASIQYFASLKEVLDTALAKLSEKGSVHILDTFFYKNAEERNAAAERTKHYYNELGYPSMGDHYFHHTIPDLEDYHYKLLYKPGSIINRITGRNNRFPWIAISR